VAAEVRAGIHRALVAIEYQGRGTDESDEVWEGDIERT
jgi:hypothetical protein